MARVVTIPIGPIFTSGPCRGIIHVIEQGDTLYLLGKRYHVSVSSIMYANPYVNIYNLQVGDELCIPVGPQPRTREELEEEVPESGTPERRVPQREQEPMERMPQREPGNMMPQREPGNMMPQSETESEEEEF